MERHLAAMETPFFQRIDRELKRSAELKRALQDLLRDVRRANVREQLEVVR